jgi:M6 family metalloprotease-like protein
MKCRHSYLFLLSTILVCVLIAPAWSMPPHPDLLEKIKAGEVPEPPFFKNIEILREKGIDTPTAIAIVRQIAAGDLKANFNAIAILVDFTDNTSSVAASYFDTLLYGTGTGTLQDYWEEATYGNLTVVTLDLPSSLGWMRAPQTYAYYVNGAYGIYGTYPRNAQRLAEDAVNLADPYVNFSNYDNDSDGYVDALFIIHSGRGAEYTGSVNDIWSHKWVTYNVPYVDAVRCSVYSMEPEYWISPGDMTCGVYAHEMGHAVFGLPDLYDYGYDSEGLGDWSLMAGGSWNGTRGDSPAHPDAYCRILTGAASATNLTSNLMGASIPAVETTPTIYRLWTNGAASTEYFLVENRRRTGYDSELPSQGLMIYHVDETQDGNDNQWRPGLTGSGNYEVALEQADGEWDLEWNNNQGDTGDPYPGSINNRTFDKNSTPDSKDYDFDTTMVAVRNISNSADTMTADLYVTVGDTPDPPTITVTYPNGGETLSGSATITWSATDPDPGETALLSIDLDYSSNGGGSWTPIATGESNDGSYLWDVSGLTDGSNYLVRATATDTAGLDDNDTSNGTFTIYNPDDPTITVTYPNGGESLNESATITWNATDPDPGETALLDIDLDYSDNGGGSWNSIATGESNDGSYLWDASGLPDGSNYLIRATAIDPTLRSDTDQSNATFTIDNPDDPIVTVTYPNGGESLNGSATITWNATDPDPGETALLDIDLDYSDNGGGSWNSIATGESNDGSHLWDVSGLPDGSNYLVRVTATDTTARSDVDVSDATFTIDNPGAPDVTITYPNGGETLSDSVTITWSASDPDPGETPLLSIDLDYSDNGGGSWNPIATGESNDGSYPWDVSGLSDGSNYLVRITATDTTARSDVDVSDATFTIDNPDHPNVTVTYPNGGETLSDSVTITWSASDPDPGETGLLLVNLDYSDTAGGAWSPIDADQANDGAYSWDMSGLPDGTDYLVRVTVTDTTERSDSDSSDAVFTILNLGPPAAISDLTATLAGSAIHLSWSAVTVDTAGTLIVVDHYTIYRNADPKFSPDPADSMGSTTGTFYDDPTPALKDTDTNHYYVVKAVDVMGRKSGDSNKVGEYDKSLTNLKATK